MRSPGAQKDRAVDGLSATSHFADLFQTFGWLFLIVATGAVFVPVSAVSLAGACALLLLPGCFVASGLRGVLHVRGAVEFVTFALCSGLALIPVALDVIWRFENSRWALASGLGLVGAIAWTASFFAARGRGRQNPESSACETQAATTAPPSKAGGAAWVGLAALLLWVGGCVFASFALPELRGPVAPRAAQDYVKHHAILMALEGGPLPLRSPFYAAGESKARLLTGAALKERPEAYYYYHYAYLWPAAMRVLSDGAVSRSVAFGLHAALVAISLVLLVFVIARRLCGSDGRALFAAACASIIGGWDVIPILFQVAFEGRAIPAIFDSWIPSPWRIHNLATQFLWCPQHVHALLTFALAGEWLARAPRSRAWLLLGPLMAASVFGASAFVSLTAFPAAAIVALRSLAPDRPTGSEGIAIVRRFAALLWIAAAGLGLMMLQLPGYLEMSRRIGGGFTTVWPRLPQALLGRLAPPGLLANWLDAPWILLIDLGIAAVALIFFLAHCGKTLTRDAAMRMLLLAGGMGVLGTFSVHDSAHEFVYGFRVCVMAMSLAGAIAAAFLWPAKRPSTVAIAGLGMAVLLGLPVGLMELPLMASRAFLRAAPLESDRGALTYLRDQTPADAIVQGDPIRRFETIQLVERRAAVLDLDNAHVQVFTPRDATAMRADRDAVLGLFASRDSAAIRQTLSRLGIDYVLVGRFERELCGDCAMFDELADVGCVYRDAEARVYRVNRQRKSDP